MDTTHILGSRRAGDSGPQNSGPTATPECAINIANDPLAGAKNMCQIKQLSITMLEFYGALHVHLGNTVNLKCLCWKHFCFNLRQYFTVKYNL